MVDETRVSSRKKNNVWRVISTQPLIVQILGSVVAALFATTIGGIITAIHARIGANAIFLISGVIALVVGLLLLARFHRGKPWVLAVIVTLTVASSAWCGAVIDRLLSPHKSSSSIAPRVVRSSNPRMGQSVSEYGLMAGDCIGAPKIRSDENHNVPSFVVVSPCSINHDAEVYFSGNIWGANEKYPGSKKTDEVATSRCVREFSNYVGIPSWKSAFLFHVIDPNATTWKENRDRQIQCIVFDPNRPINYSAKRTER